MALTGPETVYLLIFLVLLTAVGAALLWDRVPTRAWLRWPLRVSMIVFCQLMACVLAAVLVNDLGRFYTSWGELFGQHSRVSARKLDPVKVSAEIAEQLRGHADGSAVISVPIPIAGARGGEKALVYLPAAYFDPAYDNRTFPVMELLTGYPGTPDSWTNPLDLQHEADGEIDAGRAAPFVAVMPSVNYLDPGHDGECLNVPRGAQVESTLVGNVRAVMQAQFRVATDRSGWGIMGYSTGGFCALNIVMRHPELFTAAASQSGYTTPYQDDTTGPIFKNNPPSFHDDNNPQWLIKNRPPPDVSVLLTTTKPDAVSYQQAADFMALVKPPMKVEGLFLQQGSHNFAAFKATVPLCLDWLSARLGGPLAPSVAVDGQVPQSTPPALPTR